MGRPALGREGRSTKAYVRITGYEEQLLTERFGSPGRGLRALIDAHLLWEEHPIAQQGPPDVEPASPLLSQDDIEAALALDKIKQTLPPVVEEPAIGADAPLPGTIAAGLADPVPPVEPVVIDKHTHRRGTLLATEYVQGVKVRTYQCTQPGCPVVLS